MKHAFRIAAAVVAAALGAPAVAHDLSSDPTQPAVENPAPAIVLHGSGRAEARALNADPTWPRTEVAAPAVALSRLASDASAAVLGDEPWASAVQAQKAGSRLASK